MKQNSSIVQSKLSLEKFNMGHTNLAKKNKYGKSKNWKSKYSQIQDLKLLLCVSYLTQSRANSQKKHENKTSLRDHMTGREKEEFQMCVAESFKYQIFKLILRMQKIQRPSKSNWKPGKDKRSSPSTNAKTDQKGIKGLPNQRSRRGPGQR